jgi:ATP-binding protein involved in chromosome partitioning
MSIGQTLPNAEVLIVTTAHSATAEVAVRSGVLAHQLRQRILGVVENMSYVICAHCGERSNIFGAGGADTVSKILHEKTGSEVPVLARIPFDDALANPADDAAPFVAAHPQSDAALALVELATQIARKPRGLVGMPLTVSPARS